jgi:hypothetical protein
MFLQKFKVNSSKDFVDRDPGKNNTIMPWSLFGKMKEDDLKAIYAYLMSVKPQKGKFFHGIEEKVTGQPSNLLFRLQISFL